MDEQAIYGRLDGIFKEVFTRDDIVLSPTLTAQDVDGWDSFKQVALIIAAEKQFGLKFKSQDIDDLENLGDFVRAIQRRAAP